MTRDQSEERCTERLKVVAIGNGAKHHYEVHDMQEGRVWIDKDHYRNTGEKRSFKMMYCELGEYGSLPYQAAYAEINKRDHWMPKG